MAKNNKTKSDESITKRASVKICFLKIVLVVISCLCLMYSCKKNINQDELTTTLPVLTGEIIIEGEPVVGQRLTVATNLTATPSTTNLGELSYQWMRNENNIEGATDSLYTLTEDDVNKKISVQVAAANCSGTILSPQIGPVVIPANPVLTGEVTIEGEPVLGQNLTVITNLTSTPVITDLGVISYQWRRNSTNIAGAINPVYTLTDADVNKKISVKVTAANCSGAVISSPVGPVIIEYDFTPSGSIDDYEYVDLGLSVKWATCNIGANTIEAIGDYYAWQETTPVTPLTHINYKYNFNPCSPDNILFSVYDAATVNLGNHWRMPTWGEMDELCKNCVWTWADNFQNKGVSGCIIKSKRNNKCIFLPASGYININNQLVENNKGFYWSSYAGPGDLWLGLISAIDLTFYKGGIAYGGNSDATDRSCGLPVRAVVGTPNTYIPEGPFPLDEEETNIQGYSVSGQKDGKTYVDLGLPSRTLWATYNVGASSPREYGNFYAWGETVPKEIYTEANYVFYDGVYYSGTIAWSRYSKYTWYEGHHGTVDGKLKLDPEDDAATQNMGSNWSMPTKAQLEELNTYVYWMQDGTSGWIGTSKINGYTVYIPSAGWEYNNVPNNHFQAWYWSSEIQEPSPANSDYYAYMLTNAPQSGLTVHNTMRIQGLSVRGVTHY